MSTLEQSFRHYTEAMNAVLHSMDNVVQQMKPKDLSRYCAACGKILSKGNYEKQRASCYTFYNKPDVWLCWSCNYDYKKLAQDNRIEVFYSIMKGGVNE